MILYSRDVQQTPHEQGKRFDVSLPQVYEEIADPSSAFNCTQCPAYVATAEVVKHDYEEVKLYGNLDIPTTQEAYQLTLCSAYGVPVQSTTSS